MGSPDLRSYLEKQQQAGRVQRISDPQSPVYQVARRIYEADDRVQIFENVAGYSGEIVANVVGSRRLLSSALGVEPGRLTEHVAGALEKKGSVSLQARAAFMDNCQEQPDLIKTVPLLTFYPRGERIYTTASVFCARHPQYGMNLSFHRMMYLGGNRFAVRVVPRHLHQILEAKKGQARVAVATGLHPAICLAAAISYGPEFDELSCASALLGEELQCFDLEGLRVPAAAEMVWLGRFTGELAEEGPFVDLTGTYDGVRQQPVFEVEKLYYRDNFRFQVILPGGLEHRLLMGVPQEPRIYKIVQNTVTGLRDVVLTPGGSGWLHAVVSLEPKAEGEAKNAGLAALAAHPSLKRVVVVDADIDITDSNAVEWAMATRVQPDRDLVVVAGAHGSSLDPSRDSVSETTAKWIIDATKPFAEDWADYQQVSPP